MKTWNHPRQGGVEGEEEGGDEAGAGSQEEEMEGQ